MTTMEELEARVNQLGLLVYGDEVKAGVEDILSKCPTPESCTGNDQKVRAYLLRARAQLLLPIFSKEAELEINKALKLNQNAPLTWVALSEAYWRRNALQEARDALDSALRIDPKCQAALCQYSRILRSMCGSADVPAEKKLQLLKDAEGRARDSVAVDPNDGDSWSALAVAILQQAVANGMELPLLKKSLAALNQAAQKAPKNPDVLYNRGAVHAAFGHFGAAICDYCDAFLLDPKGLKSAKASAESLYALLQKARSKISAGYAGMTERDFKKNIAPKLPNSGRDGSQTFVQLADIVDKTWTKDSPVQWVAVKVMDLLSSPADQPLVYLVADKNGSSCLLLAYRLVHTAMKLGDVVTIPFPPSSAATLAHSLPDIPCIDVKKDTFAVPTMVVEPSTLVVNGAPIPSKLFTMPRMDTRQFQ